MADNPPVTCDGPPRPGMTGAQRQAQYRVRLRRVGLVAIQVVIPSHSAADFLFAAEALRSAKHLTLGPLRDPVSGKLVSPKSMLVAAKSRD